MNRGFTLLEIMVVVAIVLILSTGGVLAIGDRIEKNAIIRAKTEIPTFIRNAIDKSFSDGVKRTVEVNTTGGAIIIKNTSPTSIELYEIGKPLTIIMTPNKFDIGEKGEVTGLGAATQAAIMVRTRKGSKNVVRVEVSNISGLNLGRVNVIKY